MENKRTVKKLVNNEFIEIKFEDLKLGDIFCLYDGGKEVKDESGNTVFKAISNTYYDTEEAEINEDKDYLAILMEPVKGKK